MTGVCYHLIGADLELYSFFQQLLSAKSVVIELSLVFGHH